MLKKDKVREAIRVIERVGNSDYCDKLLEQDYDAYEFFIGLNGFLLLKIDTCIEFLDTDGVSYVINIDEEAQPEFRKVLNEQFVTLGQSVKGLLKNA